MEYRIALVDDHSLLRGAMAQILGAAPDLPTLHIIQESSMGKLRAWLDAGTTVDLVMLELGLPDLGGLPGLAGLRNDYPTIPVIVMSDRDDAGLIDRCALLGVAGYVHKPGTAKAIREAVWSVLEGHGWHPDEFAARSPRRHLPVRTNLQFR